MTLETWECKNPETVAIRREARTCRGCRHIESVKYLGSVHAVCRLFPQRSLERKCRSYAEVGQRD